MTRKIRLLPLVIFAASLTFSLKIGTLWQDFGVSWSTPAVAEAKKPAADAPAKSKSASSKPDAKTQAKKKPGADGSSDEGGSNSPEFDASTATDTEIELLQKLSRRRGQLDQRERQLKMRQSIMSATERRIDAKIVDLAKIKATIEGLLKKHDSQQEAKFKSLVKIYENMKPKDAARIFDRLELGILLEMVERMRESKTAPIMANMSPARANTVTSALARRRTLPRPRQPTR